MDIIDYLKSVHWNTEQAGMPEKLEVYNNLVVCLRDIGDVMERFYEDATPRGKLIYRDIRALKKGF